MSGWLTTVLRFRLLVLGAAVGVGMLGAVQLRDAPVDTLPEFTPPYAEVQTEALGLSAEEVEQLITVPLEADLLNGVEGIEVIRSQSVPGLSSVVMVFEEGTDVYRARQLVQERLTQAHALPNVSKPPVLLPPLSSSNRVLMIGLSSESVPLIEQSVIARWTIRPRLMGVPGVANVSIWGMRDQQLQVQVDPERLRSRGITLAQVVSSAGNAQVVSPLTFLEASTPGTGGFIETPQQRLQVRHLIEKIADPAALREVPVEGTGGRLRLGDVAQVTVDHQPLIGDAVVHEEPGLLLVVEKFPGADAGRVTSGVERAMEELRPGLSGITDTVLFRPASYVDDGLESLGLAAAWGVGLMLAVLMLLRRDWRSLLVVTASLAVILTGSVLLLRWSGQGLHWIMLAGIVAAVTIAVDHAVGFGDRLGRAVRDADPAATAPSLLREVAADVRGPMVYSALIVLLAVTPAAVLGGRPGAFFRPSILAVAVGVAVSVLVLLTVAPALAALMLDQRGKAPGDPALVRWAHERYRRSSSRWRRSLRLPLLAAVVLLVLAGLAVPWLGSAPLPSFRDRTLLVQVQGDPGTSAPQMVQVASDLGTRLRELPGVATVAAHVGRAVNGDRVTDVHSADVWVHLEPGSDHDEASAAVEGTARGIPDVTTKVTTYTGSVLSQVGALRDPGNATSGSGLSVLTGAAPALTVRVYGQDQQTLLDQAERVRQLLSGVDGTADVRIESPPTQPTLEIEVDLARAQAMGVTPGDVRRTEATMVQGIQVGSVFEDQKVFDVIVQGVPELRDSAEDVRDLLVDRPSGGHVRLAQVADVRISELPSVIEREGVSRRMDVSAQVSGRSIGDVTAEVESRLAELTFPLEYHAEVRAQTTDSEIGAARVVAFAVGAAGAIFLLLQAASGSWRVAGLVVACLPVALTGGVVGMLAAGAEVTFGALLGHLVLIGVFMHAALLLLGSVRRRRRADADADAATVVERGAHDRLIPVLTLTAALVALLAPALALGARPGLEVLHPMAAVVVVGVLTSAFVTLFVLPALLPLVASALDREDGDALGSREDLAEPMAWHGTTSTVYDSRGSRG